MDLTDDKELTMAERRELIERMTEIIMTGIINRDDRRDIYCVCLAACDREMPKMRKENGK